MENKGRSDLVGSSAAPYINSLINNYAYFSNAHAVSHPSLPNYLALFFGSDEGVADDHCPPASGGYGGANLATQVAVGSWVENAPSDLRVCNADGGLYQGHHVPWAYAANGVVSTSPNGRVNFYIPNDCDNMHDCSIATGDAFLASLIPTLPGITVLLWDEGYDADYSSNNMLLVILGPGISAQAHTENVTHYSVLRWIEAQEGVGCLAQACSAPPIVLR